MKRKLKSHFKTIRIMQVVCIALMSILMAATQACSGSGKVSSSAGEASSTTDNSSSNASTPTNEVVPGNASTPTNVVVPGNGGTVPITSMFFSAINIANGNGFHVTSNLVSAALGTKISAVGDFNGDGYNDFMVGAPNATFALVQSAGKTFVILGGPKRTTDLIADDLNGTNGGITLLGGMGNGLGGSMSAVGDYNGDGRADILVGAPTKGLYAGEGYLLFGGPSLSALANFQPINFDPLSAIAPNKNGLKFIAPANAFGYGVAKGLSAGDFNGDGLSDVAVSAVAADTNGALAGTEQGQVYLLLGKSSGHKNLNISNSLNFANDSIIKLNGSLDSMRLGTELKFIGDINGDGLNDLAIGGPNSNRVYIVFGTANPSAIDNLDLESLNGFNGGFILTGPTNIGFGLQVSPAGDLNGDGIQDFMILAPTFGKLGTTNSYQGAAYIIFGNRSNASLAATDVNALDGIKGFAVYGSSRNFSVPLFTHPGLSELASLGDINGDGFGDLGIVQPLVPINDVQVGKVFIIYGRNGNFADLNRANLEVGLTGANGFALVGEDSPDRNVNHIAGAGDINNDGFADILIGQSGGGPSNGGQVYVLYGSKFLK